ncbi:MAG: UPF0280 family protein [Desulfobulbaceae bacterium]|jgi:ApbE superfamily uncharacterized protein (UPF0280 family)|nr:UPF0280 family protein [Desulfobulbaceae bacterium]
MRKPLSYRHRGYRGRCQAEGLVTFTTRVEESDLHIIADADAQETARERLLFYRGQLERYIDRRPEFLTALSPISDDPLAPIIIRAMLKAAALADVGPMAAVAGAVAECVGRDLLAGGLGEVAVENGGDIFLARKKDALVEIFAADSPHSGRMAVKIIAADMPVGLCTSSASIGHSLSFGKADAATVVADSAALADAAATRLGNMVSPSKGPDCGIAAALQEILTIKGLRGALAICGQLFGAAGAIELVGLSAP